MRIKVLIPAYFRHLTAEKAEILCAVPTAKANLKHLFDELEKLHPGLKSAVFGSDGRPKRFSGLLINSRPLSKYLCRTC